MKKMLFLALLAFNIKVDYLSAQVPATFIEAKKAINTAMKSEEHKNDPLFVITVRRTSKSLTDARTTLISNEEFEQVLKILYASCAGKIAPIYDKAGSELSTKTITTKEMSELQTIKTACTTLRQYYHSKKMDDHSKIIVLNEMFFSQIESLSPTQKNFLSNKILSLSSENNKAAFLINFLYKEVRTTTKEKAMQGLQIMKDMFSDNADAGGQFKKMHMFDGDAINFCEAKITQTFPDEEEHNCNYLINETQAIWNGNTVAQYKKSSYCVESDSDINNGYIYEFGDGKTHRVNGHNNVQDMLINNIIIEICYDLFCGVRKSNNWTNEAHNANIIHVIQSNSINPHNSAEPHDNINRLPLNTGIIHSDPWDYPINHLFFVENPILTDPRVEKNIAYSSKESISVPFYDSMYTVTIYEI